MGGMRHQQQSSIWSRANSTDSLPTPPSLHSPLICQQTTGGNPDSNTLISDMTTVICLDDYHSLDRKGRAKEGVTALAPEAQNFDLMAQQVCLGPSG